MPAARYTPGEIVRRGQQWYEQEIKSQVQVHQGKMLAVDVHTGEYAFAEDSLATLDGLEVKVADASPFLIRIGYPTAVQVGAGRKANLP